MSSGDRLTLQDIPDNLRENGRKGATGKVINLPDDGCALEDLEREIVTEALERNGFVIARAARELKISRPSMYALIKKYGIRD